MYISDFSFFRQKP